MKYPKLLLFLLIISAFGPYAFGGSGIRVEHLVIYPMSIYFLFFFDKNYKLDKSIFGLIIIHVFILISISLITIIGKYPILNYYKLFADIENHLQPIATIFLVSFVFYKTNDEDKKLLFFFVLKTLLFVMMINTFIAITTFFFDTWQFLKYFVGDSISDASDSIAGRVLKDNGRILGIFGQPFEAGISYSIALFSIYLLHENKQIVGFKLYFSILIIFIGGILTVSKIFFPLTFVILFVLLFLNKKINYKHFFYFFIFLILFILTISKYWNGFDYLLRLFYIGDYANNDEGIVSLMSAGRFGSDDQLILKMFKNVLNESPFFGYGFGTLDGATDNGFYEYFSLGGILGLILYIIVYFILFYFGIKYYKYSKIGKFYFSFLIFIFFADMGCPAFTINRASILLITTLISTISIMKRERNIFYCKQLII